MEKMMQPWLANPVFKDKSTEDLSNTNYTNDKTKDKELDSLRQQIEELRDIITKKSS